MGSGKKSPDKGVAAPVAPALAAGGEKVVRVVPLPGGGWRVEIVGEGEGA